MGKWATYQRRGSATVPPVRSPVLFQSDSSELSWTWTDSDPVDWNLEFSNDGVTGWDYYSTIPGADRLLGSLPQHLFYRITGTNGAGTNTTDPSNVCEITY